MDATDQAGIDKKMLELDGTEFKSKLGRQCDPRRVAGGCQGRGRRT